MNGAATAIDRRRRVAIVAVVAILHAGALVWLGLNVIPVLPEASQRAFDVVLMRPSAPIPPLDHARSGGGAPAAPSRIHRTVEPVPDAVELIAPTTPALIQPLTIGVSTIVSDAAAMGDGGAGMGDGSGSGEGRGTGGGMEAVLIAGPAGAALSRDVDAGSLVRAGRVHVVLRCRIRLTQRLERCRVIGEHPEPSGYRAAAIDRAREFRFRPPERGGRPLDNRPIVVAIEFPGPPA